MILRCPWCGSEDMEFTYPTQIKCNNCDSRYRFEPTHIGNSNIERLHRINRID